MWRVFFIHISLAHVYGTGERGPTGGVSRHCVIAPGLRVVG
jgi:hypothetical protein